MSRRKRTDDNHAEAKKWFHDLGCSVVDLSQVGGGCPDLLVAKHGQSMLVEIKQDHGKLSAGQVEFMQTWKGICRVVRTREQAIEAENALYSRSTKR